MLNEKFQMPKGSKFLSIDENSCNFFLSEIRTSGTVSLFFFLIIVNWESRAFHSAEYLTFWRIFIVGEVLKIWNFLLATRWKIIHRNGILLWFIRFISMEKWSKSRQWFLCDKQLNTAAIFAVEDFTLLDKFW